MRIRTVLAAIVLATLTLTPAPAEAAGHTVKHHKPDAGYDDPMLVRCANGLSYLIAEGHSSTQSSPAKPDCNGVTKVYVRKGEEWWCLVTTETFKRHWQKSYDSTGWHKLARSCDGVLRKD
jgi:hypothetical protein